jgi:hypothetical protein
MAQAWAETGRRLMKYIRAGVFVVFGDLKKLLLL